jgi:hypothetical protein
MYYLWKERKAAADYENSIYSTTALLFKKDIIVSDILLIRAKEGQAGGRPLIEGKIRNNSGKIVSSVLMEISFITDDGVVVYKQRFHPCGTGPGNKDFGSPFLYPLMSPADNMLLPGGSISFRHILSNCDNDLIHRVRNGSNVNNKEEKKDLEFVYSIIGLSVL